MGANRELLSAYFSVLHLPPLPVVVNRVDREDNAVTDDNATYTFARRHKCTTFFTLKPAV